MEKVLPEDLECKFKSKHDLYDLLSIDLHYHLPPFEKCPIHYLRQVLAGEKKVVKKEAIKEIAVPRYKELSVYKVWPLVQVIDDLLIYFPDYKENQFPERSFMYSILATFRFNVVNSMVQNARRNRAAANPEDKNRVVHVTKNMYAEIRAVMTHKVTKGRASYLLRRSANLGTVRKKAKEYDLLFDNLHKNEEEKKDEEENNMN